MALKEVSTWVDSACVYPGVQQVVGAIAATVHLARAVEHIFQQVFNKRGWKASQRQNKEDLKWAIHFHPWNKARDTAYHKYRQKSCKADISRFFTSLIQTIPVIGSLYSYAVLDDAIVHINLFPRGCGGGDD